jgi:hypothetical protein
MTFAVSRQFQASHSFFNNNEQIKDSTKTGQCRAMQGKPKLLNKQIKDFY